MSDLDVDIYLTRREKSEQSRRPYSFVGGVRHWGRGRAEQIKMALTGRRRRSSATDELEEAKNGVVRSKWSWSSVVSGGMLNKSVDFSSTELHDFQVFIYPKSVHGLPAEYAGDPVKLMWMGEVGGKGGIISEKGEVNYENLVITSRVTLALRHHMAGGSSFETDPRKLH
eukprot:scaffold166244_cov36-Prasinocladus_malaysianus.AAC.1